MKKKYEEMIHELKHHAPITIIATVVGIALVVLFQFVLTRSVSERTFEILHPVHIIASAVVSSAIFYSRNKNVLKALLVGILGAIIIGTLSDVIVPYLGGLIFSLETTFHLPLFEEPLLILASAVIGSFIGITTKLTKFPHLIHVFLSVFASLFYLVAFSPAFNILGFIGAFIIVFIAVIIPCCMSDIVFPFLFLGQKIKTCNC